MGLVIKLNNIISPNAFTVSYKTGPNPYPLDSGFTSFGGTYSAGTTLVVVSGITINFNSTYWFKITDTTTNRYIIENVETNDPIAYTTCCEVPTGISAVCVIPTTPTPTPTATPTPTPTVVCDVPTNITAFCSDATPTPTPTPTATPTVTPTPTPTTTATTYEYYYAQQYDCNGCTDMGTVLVAFDSNETAPLPNRFYQRADANPDGYAYKILYSTLDSGVAVILTINYGSATSCSLACVV